MTIGSSASLKITDAAGTTEDITSFITARTNGKIEAVFALTTLVASECVITFTCANGRVGQVPIILS